MDKIESVFFLQDKDCIKPVLGNYVFTSY